MLKFQIDDDILMKCEWHADYSRPHSELKYSMTIRPATHGMKSGSDSGPPSIQMASATAGSSASATASAPSGAPGTPPHDSLGYFSEPEIIITPFDGSVSDISVWNFPPFLFLIYWIPAQHDRMPTLFINLVSPNYFQLLAFVYAALFPFQD